MRRLAPNLSPSTILRSGGKAFSTTVGPRMRSQKPINLLRGWPNPSLLPASQLNAAAQIAFTTPAIYEPGLQYGPDPGYQPLRDEVSKWLAEFYQTDQGGDPEEICITGGASQNVACVLQVFSDPIYTKRVWVVAPCYFLACRIFEDAGFAGRLRAVPEGETGEGIDLEWLEREIEKVDADIDQSEAPLKQPRSYAKIYRHIIYCVPTFSNPSGSSMSLNARENIVKLARKHDALLISDDVYDFLQWPITPTTPTTTTPPLNKALLPRLVDLDRTLTPTPTPESFGNVLSNGSFSKIAGPGMRVGFASATRKLIYGLSQCGSSRSGGAPSQMSSTIMHQLLASGTLTKHIHEILQPTYQRRHAIMINALKEYVIPLGIRLKKQSLKGEDIFGGFFIWLDLPEGVDAEVLANWCLESENLVVAAGPIFAVDGDDSLRFETCIRVCFSWEGEPELQEGIERLGRALKDVLSGKAGGKEGLLSGSGLKQSLGEFQ